MSSMHEIKTRIKSIKETRQITNAMKLISAAKLKKARQLLEQALPYFDKVKETIADIIMHSESLENSFFDLRNEKVVKKKGYVIFTGDKGLAGGYNSNIIKLAENELQQNPDSVLLIAGNVGKNHFLKKACNVYPYFDYSVHNPTVYRAREMAELTLDLFQKGELDEIYLVYTLMQSSLNLSPQIMKLLPLDLSSLRKDLKIDVVPSDLLSESLIYEPSPNAVFDILIPKYLKGIIYGAMVESFTSEQTARMSAMDNATANADEILHKLNLYYNRARQAAITQEISEIVGGAAALMK